MTVLPTQYVKLLYPQSASMTESWAPKIQRKPSTAQASPASRYSTTSTWLAFFTPAQQGGYC